MLMNRRSFAFAALPALVAGGLLLFADQAQAQRFRNFVGGVGTGWYGGYSPSYGGYGWGNAYSPTYGWGNSYSPLYGRNYYSGMYNTYPSNWDYSWNYPSGSFYSGMTPGGNYYGYQPSYYYSGMNTADFNNYAGMNNMQGGYTSFYSNDQVNHPDVPDTAALINMRVHPDAKIWFSGDETKSQGGFRQYVTPALDTGRTYYYEIRARWNENGRDIDRTRRVLVHAGDRTNVDFMRDMTAVDEMSPEHPRQRENVRPGDRTTPTTERRFYEEDRNAPAPPATNQTNNSQSAPVDNARPRTTTDVTPATPGGTSGSNPPASNPSRPPR
jgi:uncharacterized protein (TIGR03000 family)